MSSLRFEWDPGKAAVNRQKHGVSFEDAQSAFADDRARSIDDPDHPQGNAGLPHELNAQAA